MPPVVVDLAGAFGLDRREIGGKAAGLATMVRLGLPVPPGFVVTTGVCRAYLEDGVVPPQVLGEIDAAMCRLERATGRRWGGDRDPLLVSVRSGAADSMPGMLDTILNVGLNARTLRGLAARTTDDAACRCHARFLAGFGAVVLGVDDLPRTDDPDVLATALRGADAEVPDDPREQLLAAVAAVFGSWRNDRARTYRKLQDIDDDAGTAVVVQAMVFGNCGPTGGTGVVFSRHPDTGEPGPWGDYLPDAQGEDVVSGTHATLPISALEDRLPAVAEELRLAVERIEAEARDLVDVEFTVEDGELHLLQFRVAKRSAGAAVRVAVDLVDEGVISPQEAVERVSEAQLAGAEVPSLEPGDRVPIVSGLGACPGVATGAICLSADRLLDEVDAGSPMILVRPDTSPNDVHGMRAAAGVLTSIGGVVSHAALVARELGVPTVVGATGLEIDESAGTVRVPRALLAEGSVISIDGSSGEVYEGAVASTHPAPGEHLARLRRWAVAPGEL